MNFSRVNSSEYPKHSSNGVGPRPFPVRILGFFLAVGLVFLQLSATESRAAGRVALVMVSDDYRKLQRSSVGVNRGTEIAEALAARGFEVILSANPSNAAARAKLRDFSNKADDADLAIAVLIGHGTAWGGQSFYLPANTELGRATDLLSRALSITTVAQIAGRARAGGVIFLMTTPKFDVEIEGLVARPQFNGEIGKNSFAAFSSSPRVPLSRVDATSEQAAEALAKVLRQPAPSLSEAVNAASNGNMGTIFGAVADVSLVKPPTAEPAVAVSRPPANVENTDVQRKLEAERQAREVAERQIRAEQVKAEQAQAEVLRAQADAKRAQAEAERAQAEARKAQAEAERAQAEAERAKLEAQRPDAQFASAQAVERLAAPVLTEDSQLGRRQRAIIQERLRDLGLYTGLVDSIIGPLTREAIMGFQKNRGAQVTGYLTAEQYDALLSTGKSAP